MLDTVALILGVIVSCCAIVGYFRGGIHRLWNWRKKKPKEAEIVQGAGIVTKDRVIMFEPKRQPIHSETKGAFSLATYKELYDFASSAGGMGMTRQDAQKWTEDWLKHYSDKSFETFKEYYHYASSATGMGLIGTEARKWALDKLLKSE